MEHIPVTWNQLVRYLGGESSPQERQMIRKWITSNPEHEAFISFLRKIWDSPAEKKEDWNVEAAWQRFQIEYADAPAEDVDAMKPVSDLSDQPPRSSTYKSSRPAFSRLAGWGAVAAAIGAIMVITFLTYDPPVDIKNEKPPMKEIVTQHGERANLRLSDGSHVVLNAGSVLRIPETFSGDERGIELSGEAYFEVIHDPQKPFVVYTEKAATQVLGTKFGVKAYPDNPGTQVVVVEGKVALRSKSAPTESGVKITKFEKGVLQAEKTSLSAIKDPAPYLGWTEGNLIFENEVMTQVIAGLERWYDITVKIEDSEVRTVKFSGSFTAKQPLDEVLDAIALSLNISYTKKDTTIIFSHKKQQTNGGL